MKILITGGMGYLGGRLVQHLTNQAGFEVIIGSRTFSGPPEWSPKTKLVQTDWSHPESLLEICSKIDAIVHLAGMNAQDCSKDPTKALEVNGCMTSKLLEAAVSQKVKRFIYLSTAHVYQSPLIGKITEETCPQNLHSYATSHRAGEDTVRAALQRKEIEGIVIRLSNSFGAPVNKNINCWMLLVNDLCKQAILTKHMTLMSSGSQRRDFITLTDACRAINHLLLLPSEKIEHGVFNVGGMWTPTVLEITELIAERIHHVIGFKPEISRKENANEKSDSLDYDISKLLGTGFTLGHHSIRESEIDELIKFCLKNLKEPR